MTIVSVENIIKILYSANPWWKNKMIPVSKSFKRFSFYQAFDCIRMNKNILIHGIRRVGKTTLLQQIIENLLLEGVNPDSILYLPFNHPILKLHSLSDLLAIYRKRVHTSGILMLFIDDAINLSNWESHLKNFSFDNPSINIIASGLCDFLIKPASSWVSIPIKTLSFYEYCKITGVNEISDVNLEADPISFAAMNENMQQEIIHDMVPLQKHLTRYLALGGFPETALSYEDNNCQKIIREDIIDKVLTKDIPGLFNIRNMAAIDKIFIYLCIKSSNIVSSLTLSKELGGTTKATVTNYMEFLERVNLIYRSMPLDITGRLPAKTSPKIYISDPAIRNSVLMLTEDVLQSSPDEMGLVAETAVYKHLSSFYFPFGVMTGYFRKPGQTQKEIDTVTDTQNGLFLIEVKYRENPLIKRNDGIVELSDSQFDISGSLVVTKSSCGKLPFNTRIPISKIPAYAFLYLTGKAEESNFKD